MSVLTCTARRFLGFLKVMSLDCRKTCMHVECVSGIIFRCLRDFLKPTVQFYNLFVGQLTIITESKFNFKHQDPYNGATSLTRHKRVELPIETLSLRLLIELFLRVFFRTGGLMLHIRISKSAYLDGQPLPLGHFSPCPSGHCHLPSGCIPLHYRPPSNPHLNNSSPATPGPLRYCRHCHGHTHKQPQTAQAFINRWREKETEAGQRR